MGTRTTRFHKTSIEGFDPPKTNFTMSFLTASGNFSIEESKRFPPPRSVTDRTRHWDTKPEQN